MEDIRRDNTEHAFDRTIHSHLSSAKIPPFLALLLLHSSLSLHWMFWLLCLLMTPYVSAQNISSSLAIPPLQWLNLNQLWTEGGAEPPPLRDAHMAYDPAKRVLIIFGGESSAGNPTQQTYILQLDSLSWRIPIPPDAQQGIPPSRSAGVFGLDSASNYREGLLVWGGKGGTGSTPLDDLWVSPVAVATLEDGDVADNLHAVLPLSKRVLDRNQRQQLSQSYWQVRRRHTSILPTRVI